MSFPRKVLPESDSSICWGWGQRGNDHSRNALSPIRDRRYLHEQYDSMKSHVECEIRHMGGPQGVEDLWIAPNLGDWLCPGKDIAFMAQHNGPVSNAFIVNDLRILSRTARYLGRLRMPTDTKRSLKRPGKPTCAPSSMRTVL